MRGWLHRLYAVHETVRIRRHSHGQQRGGHRLREVHQLRQMRRKVPGEGDPVRKIGERELLFLSFYILNNSLIS